MAQKTKFENIEGLFETFEGYGLLGSIEERENESVFSVNGPYPVHGISEAEALAAIEKICRDFVEHKGLTEGQLVWIFKLCINEEYYVYESHYDIKNQQLKTVRQPLEEVIDLIVPPGLQKGFRVGNFFIIKNTPNTLTVFEAGEYQLLAIEMNPDGLGLEVKSLGMHIPGTHIDESVRARMVSRLEAAMEQILEHFNFHSPKPGDPQILKDSLYEVIENKGGDRPLAPVTFELTGQEPATLEVSKIFTARSTSDDGRIDDLKIYGNGKDLWLYSTSIKDGTPEMKTLEKITLERAFAIANDVFDADNDEAPENTELKTIN